MAAEPRITNTWYDDEQTIIHSTIEGQMTWDVFTSGYTDAIRMMRDVAHDVYLITISQPSYRVARGNAFPHIKRFYVSVPQNLQTQILVNASLLERTVLATFARLHPEIRFQPRFAKTLPDALTVIEQMKAEQIGEPIV